MTEEYSLIKVGGLSYNLRLYFHYLRLNWLEAIEFRMGFLTIIFQILMSILVWSVYWSVILDNTSGTLANWDPRELLVWYALTEFGIGVLGLGSGLAELIFVIHEDGLENYLSRPVDVLVSASADQMYVLSLVRAVFGFALLVAAMIYFSLYHLWFALLSALLLSIMGCILLVALYILFVALSFYLGRIQTIFMMLMDLELNLVRLPQHILPRMVFLSLLVIYPIGMLATLPTLIIFKQWWFDSITSIQILGLDIVVIVLGLIGFWLARSFFNFSLRFYVPVGE